MEKRLTDQQLAEMRRLGNDDGLVSRRLVPGGTVAASFTVAEMGRLQAALLAAVDELERLYAESAQRPDE
jgi:hypothetical protein